LWCPLSIATHCAAHLRFELSLDCNSIGFRLPFRLSSACGGSQHWRTTRTHISNTFAQQPAPVHNQLSSLTASGQIYFGALHSSTNSRSTRDSCLQLGGYLSRLIKCRLSSLPMGPDELAISCNYSPITTSSERVMRGANAPPLLPHCSTNAHMATLLLFAQYVPQLATL